MQSCWYSFSFSFQAGLLNTESNLQACYHSYSNIHYDPSQCGSKIICHGDSCFQGGIFFHMLPRLHFNLGVYQRWICWHPPVPLIVSFITPWTIHYLLGPWVECFQPYLDVSGKLYLSSSCIISSSSIHISGSTCLRSVQTLILVDSV